MLAESIRDELVKVFTVPQSEVLAQCVVRAHDALATRSDVHDLRVAMTALAEQQKLTSAEVRDLADTVRTLHIRTDKTAGWALEWVVGNRLPAYVGRQIKRCRVVGPMDVIESLENRPAIRELSDEDLDQLRRADLIATGVIDDEKIYLVGEVSFTADNDDVLRAARRAAVLRKIGERAQPFVACDAITPISAELARREGVWIIVEGRLLTPAA
jgi:hypothetical protein